MTDADIERTEIDHIYASNVPAALRKVADMLDEDEHLCLIGLWNYPEVEVGEAMLQTVFTRLES
jgi:hypothetical protein